MVAVRRLDRRPPGRAVRAEVVRHRRRDDPRPPLPQARRHDRQAEERPRAGDPVPAARPRPRHLQRGEGLAVRLQLGPRPATQQGHPRLVMVEDPGGGRAAGRPLARPPPLRGDAAARARPLALRRLDPARPHRRRRPGHGPLRAPLRRRRSRPATSRLRPPARSQR